MRLVAGYNILICSILSLLPLFTLITLTKYLQIYFAGIVFLLSFASLITNNHGGG